MSALDDLTKEQKKAFITWMEKYNDADLYNYDHIELEYEELLDEVHDSVQISGLTYSAGEVLKAVDPVAFRCGVSDWSSEKYIEVSGTDDGTSYDYYIQEEDVNDYVEKFLESLEEVDA